MGEIKDNDIKRIKKMVEEEFQTIPLYNKFILHEKFSLKKQNLKD